MDLKENKWYYTLDDPDYYESWYIDTKERWVTFVNRRTAIRPSLVIAVSSGGSPKVTDIANSENLSDLIKLIFTVTKIDNRL